MTRRREAVRRPEELVAWQRCMELAQHVARITATGRVAADRRFCEQLRAAARGPAALIAEGFGRAGVREFARYLRMALGSLFETRTHLAQGRDCGYFSPEVHVRAATLCGRAVRMTQRLLAAKERQLQDQRCTLKRPL